MARNAIIDSLATGIAAGGVLRELNENTAEKKRLREIAENMGDIDAAMNDLDYTAPDLGLAPMKVGDKSYTSYSEASEAKKATVEGGAGDTPSALPDPGSPSSDTLADTPPEDGVIRSGAGDDNLVGSAGNDTVFGGAGDGALADPIEQAMNAMGQVESGNNWSAIGPEITNGGMYHGDRAYGRFQVMGRNIPSWTREALGRSMTPQEFLRDHKAQKAVFVHKFGRNMAERGFQDAASIWHSGRPLSEAGSATDGYMRTVDYVNKASSFFDGSGNFSPTTSGPGAPSAIPVDPRAEAEQRLADMSNQPVDMRNVYATQTGGQTAIPVNTDPSYQPIRPLSEFV